MEEGEGWEAHGNVTLDKLYSYLSASYYDYAPKFVVIYYIEVCSLCNTTVPSKLFTDYVSA